MTAVFCFIALFCSIASCSGPRYGTYPGEVAPDIKGVSPSGEAVTLHSLIGKALIKKSPTETLRRVILLNFWATWCAPCMAELPALQGLYSELNSEGLLVVGVAVDDSLGDLKEAIARYGITYPIILDNEGRSKRLFELKGYPESFVLDGELKVQIVADISSGAPVTKIIGPREWAAPNAIASFRQLLSGSRTGGLQISLYKGARKAPNLIN